MKILIMEDENQIREGLKTEIDWESFGIHEIFTANNGERGFFLAKQLKPDIILTDIRMPHMDGITAVKKFRKIQPRCSVIFLSAYPEKEYFKEAIHLHAVSFVEKPIDRKELAAVIKKAVHEQLNLKEQQEQEKKAFLYYGEQCSFWLTRGGKSKEELSSLLKNAGIHTRDYSLFASVILSYTKDLGETEEDIWNLSCMKLQEKLSEAPAAMLVSRKHPKAVICHLFMHSKQQYDACLNWLLESMEGVRRIHILAGKPEYELAGISKSYNSAVFLKNQAFYSPYGQIIRQSNQTIWMSYDTSAWRAEAAQLLNLGKYKELQELLDSIYNSLMEHPCLHYVIVQNLYFSLWETIRGYVEQKNIFNSSMKEILFNPLLKEGNLKDFHTNTIEIIRLIEAASLVEEDEFIRRIKKYIHLNFENPELSVCEIAEVMGKSMSYLCVVFKKETGATLNQYLTEVRIEAAKVLLKNPRNNIHEIAMRCGYTDSSYFARAFKKITGQSPSGYREEEK